jgi:hypothetical protein
MSQLIKVLLPLLLKSPKRIQIVTSVCRRVAVPGKVHVERRQSVAPDSAERHPSAAPNRRAAANSVACAAKFSINSSRASQRSHVFCAPVTRAPRYAGMPDSVDTPAPLSTTTEPFGASTMASTSASTARSSSANHSSSALGSNPSSMQSAHRRRNETRSICTSSSLLSSTSILDRPDGSRNTKASASLSLQVVSACSAQAVHLNCSELKSSAAFSNFSALSVKKSTKRIMRALPLGCSRPS